jgi:hypothetical protein
MRKIAPRRIAFPTGAELHHRVPAVGLDIFAQCRDLGDQRVELERHGAMVDAGRVGRNTGALGPRDDFVGQQFGGEVDVGGLRRGRFEQRVAHDPADGPRATLRAVEQRQQPLRFGTHQPLARLQPVGVPPSLNRPPGSAPDRGNCG